MLAGVDSNNWRWDHPSVADVNGVCIPTPNLFSVIHDQRPDALTSLVTGWPGLLHFAEPNRHISYMYVYAQQAACGSFTYPLFRTIETCCQRLPSLSAQGPDANSKQMCLVCLRSIAAVRRGAQHSTLRNWQGRTSKSAARLWCGYRWMKWIMPVIDMGVCFHAHTRKSGLLHVSLTSAAILWGSGCLLSRARPLMRACSPACHPDSARSTGAHTEGSFSTPTSVGD